MQMTKIINTNEIKTLDRKCMLEVKQQQDSNNRVYYVVSIMPSEFMVKT